VFLLVCPNRVPVFWVVVKTVITALLKGKA
jgi:hypothetical protein